MANSTCVLAYVEMQRRLSTLLVGFWGWWQGALPALFLFGLLAAAIHAGARRLGFIGDSWAILYQAAPGWREALGTALGYHYIPVASGWTRLLYALLGDRESLYAIVNIVELGVVGWLTFLLGRRLLGHPFPGLLAGSLLIGSAAFPDITYWPLVGNFHCLAVAFSIGAIAAAADLAQEKPPRAAPWWFAAALAGAAFTYEGTVTLLPTAISWCLVRSIQRSGFRSLFRLDHIAGLLRRFAPSVPVVAALFLAKIRFADATASAIAPQLDLDRVHSLAHSLLGIFMLRSAYDVLERTLFFGGTPSHDQTRAVILVGLAFALGLWTLLRSHRDAGLLVLWLAIHLVIGVIALPFSPRHRFLPSVPGLLLLALAFCWMGEWLARHLAQAARNLDRASSPGALPARSHASAAWAVPLGLTLILLISAQGELHRAQELFRRAGVAVRLSVDHGRAHLPSRTAPATLTLVNAPAHLVEGGVTASVFDNVTQGLMRFRLGGVRLELVHTWTDLPGWKEANASRRVDAAALTRRIADPSRVVLSFDRSASQIQLLTLDGFRMPVP